jgi:hypothetical protein
MGPRSFPHRKNEIIKIILYSQFSQKITSNIHGTKLKIKKLQIIYMVGKNNLKITNNIPGRKKKLKN